MLPQSPVISPQTGFFDIASQLNPNHMLLALSRELDWSSIESSLSPLCSAKGRRAKPIRLMSGLLMLKQLYNLSDDSVVEQWQMNPYYQVFCGETVFQTLPPCHSTELVKFRQRIGEEGVKQLFHSSVLLHGQASEEITVHSMMVRFYNIINFFCLLIYLVSPEKHLSI